MQTADGRREDSGFRVRLFGLRRRVAEANWQPVKTPGLWQQEWLKILTYLVGTLVLGALLAPLLFWGGKEVVRQGWLAGFQPGLFLHDAMERSEFPRFFNRAMMLVALILLYPVIRWLRFRGWEDLRIVKNPCAFRDVCAGFILAAGLLLLMGSAFLYFDFFVPEAEPDWDDTPSIFASALAVGLLEEVFFRGAILGVLLRQMRAVWAVLGTSVLYAILHFTEKPDVEIAAAEVEWSTGLWWLGQLFSGLTDWERLAAAFVTLTAVGLVLAIVRLRTWSLWLPIGLHMGWVFGLKLFGAVTDDGLRLATMMPWVGTDLKTGLIPLIVIVITGAFASLWIDLSRQPRARENLRVTSS